MSKLITKPKSSLGYVNDLTKEMDSYLKYKDNILCTYLYDADKPTDKGYIAIRFPGATRGHIKVNKDNIIEEIKLYDDKYNLDKIYEFNVRDCFEKYIGMKLVLVNTIKANCVTCGAHTYVNETVILTSENKQKVIHICDNCLEYLKVIN